MRKVAVGMVLGLLALGAGMVAPSPAAAVSNQYAHQFNLAGATMNQGSLFPADVVVYSVVTSNPHPLVVTTNEVCLSQYISIRDRLAPAGYRAARSITKSSVPACGGQSFGNALFIKSGAAMAEVINYPYPTQDGLGETRRLLCGRVNNGAYGHWVGCVTHLSAVPATTPWQANEAIYKVNSEFGIAGASSAAT